MPTFSKSDKLESLSAEQLKLMGDSDPIFVVGFLESSSVYDVHRVRLLMELGAIEAKRRFEALATPTPAVQACTAQAPDA